MSNFWDKLTEPIPFYTVSNVNDTITYIENHADPPNRKIYCDALMWVRAVLTKNKYNSSNDRRSILIAHEAAVNAHDKSVLQKDFVGGGQMALCNDSVKRLCESCENLKGGSIWTKHRE